MLRLVCRIKAFTVFVVNLRRHLSSKVVSQFLRRELYTVLDSGWVVSLFISYREGFQCRLATFMLNETWLNSAMVKR